MSDEWIVLEKRAAPKKRVPLEIGLSFMGRSAKTLGHDALPSARIALTTEVKALLKMKTKRCEVRVGAGGRKHQLAIIGDPAGGLEMHEYRSGRSKNKSSGIFYVNLPQMPSWPKIQGRWRLEFAVETIGGQQAIVADLPAFFWDTRAKEQREKHALQETRPHA